MVRNGYCRGEKAGNHAYVYVCAWMCVNGSVGGMVGW